MKSEYSSYDGYLHPAIIFDNDGTLVYMNEAAKKIFGSHEEGKEKCHYIYRGFNSECKNYIKCVCGKQQPSGNPKLSFIREAVTTKGNHFFIVEKKQLPNSTRYIEQLYDITEVANSYIESGLMTKDELENMIIESESMQENTLRTL